MAVNIISSPSALSHISQKVQWKLTLSDLGSFPISKEIVVQLYINGDIASDIRTIRPESTIDQVQFDFTDTVASRLKTSIVGSSDITDFSALVKLKYGEASYNSTNCAESTQDLTEETNEIRVFNSNIQYFDNDPIDPNGYIFSDRPLCYDLPLNTLDNIVGYGDCSVTKTTYSGDVMVTASSPQVLPPGVWSYDHGNTFLQTTELTHYTLSFAFSNKTILYRVNILKYDRPVIYFLEPKGSYTPMVFDKGQLSTVNRVGKLVDILPNGISIAEDLQDYGITEYDLNNYEEISIAKKKFIHEGLKPYYFSFANASKFVMKNGFNDPNNPITSNARYVRLIIPTERIPYFVIGNVIEIKATGYFATSLSTHKYA